MTEIVVIDNIVTLFVLLVRMMVHPGIEYQGADQGIR